MKVTTDGCLFGAWVAEEIRNGKIIFNNSLDIGAGTGVLALMIAQQNVTGFIDAIEIDKDAAQQAKENIESSPWSKKINIINADVRTYLFKNKYDLIVSNPPFYEKEIRSSTDRKNIALHSDELKLGELLSVIKYNMAPNGSFFLLLPYKRNEEVKRLLHDRRLHIEKLIFVRQSVSHDYFRIMLRGQLKESVNEETTIEEISIWNEKQQYTDEFIHLLKDYYLYL